MLISKKKLKWELLPQRFGLVLDYFCSLRVTIYSIGKKNHTKARNDKK